MTGRRLYDHYADTVANTTTRHYWDNPSELVTVPVIGVIAWPMLTMRDRRMWNELARRITPKPRKAKNVSRR